MPVLLFQLTLSTVPRNIPKSKWLQKSLNVLSVIAPGSTSVKLTDLSRSHVVHIAVHQTISGIKPNTSPPIQINVLSYRIHHARPTLSNYTPSL